MCSTQWFIRYSCQTESEITVSHGHHFVVLHVTKKKLNKTCIFLMVYYHAHFQDLMLSAPSVASTSQVRVRHVVATGCRKLKYIYSITDTNEDGWHCIQMASASRFI
jgi:hypothetical protein